MSRDIFAHTRGRTPNGLRTDKYKPPLPGFGNISVLLDAHTMAKHHRRSYRIHTHPHLRYTTTSLYGRKVSCTVASLYMVRCVRNNISYIHVAHGRTSWKRMETSIKSGKRTPSLVVEHLTKMKKYVGKPKVRGYQVRDPFNHQPLADKGDRHLITAHRSSQFLSQTQK